MAGDLSPGLSGSNYQVSARVGLAVSGNVAILAILAIHGKARPSHEKQPGPRDQHRPWAASASAVLAVHTQRPGPGLTQPRLTQSRPGQPQVCDQGRGGWCDSRHCPAQSSCPMSRCLDLTMRLLTTGTGLHHDGVFSDAGMPLNLVSVSL